MNTNTWSFVCRLFISKVLIPKQRPVILRENSKAQETFQNFCIVSSVSDNVCMTNINMILKFYTELQFKAYLDFLAPVQHLLWMGFTECVSLLSRRIECLCLLFSCCILLSFSVLLLIWLKGQYSGKIQADVMSFSLFIFSLFNVFLWEVKSLCARWKILKSLLV